MHEMGMNQLVENKGQLRWLWLSIFIIVLDQCLKHYLNLHLVYGQSVALLPFFNLTLAHNTGAAYSFLSQSSGWQKWLFGGFAAIVSVAIIIYLANIPKHKKLLACALALILAGALGNLIDRVTLGYVIDFFDFHIGHWHFAIFNIADTAVTIGAGLLIIDLILTDRKKKKHE